MRCSNDASENAALVRGVFLFKSQITNRKSQTKGKGTKAKEAENLPEAFEFPMLFLWLLHFASFVSPFGLFRLPFPLELV